MFVINQIVTIDKCVLGRCSGMCTVVRLVDDRVYCNWIVGWGGSRCSSGLESWVRWRSCVTTVWARSWDGCSLTSEVTSAERSSRNSRNRGEKSKNIREFDT